MKASEIKIGCAYQIKSGAKVIVTSRVKDHALGRAAFNYVRDNGDYVRYCDCARFIRTLTVQEISDAFTKERLAALRRKVKRETELEAF